MDVSWGGDPAPVPGSELESQNLCLRLDGLPSMTTNQIEVGKDRMPYAYLVLEHSRVFQGSSIWNLMCPS